MEAVIVLKDRDNFIIVDPGSNYKLALEMIDGMEEQINECAIMMIQLEIPIETVERAISIATVVGALTVMKKADQRSLPFLEEVERFRREKV